MCGKLPLGRPRCKWEDNIEVELKEGGRRVWTGLTYCRMCSCEHVFETSALENAGNFKNAFKYFIYIKL
jgi:hypothetical protein